MNGILKNTFIRMAILALILFCGILFVTLRLENNALAAKAEDLREQAEILKEDINELKADIERPFDAEYIAEVAQEKLGLRYPQEVVFYTGENE
ncbi:MAG: septum formation initiator family protein [Clostridia bacterium]|nr:septum formation initiator family protein [Clostridia bacterium]